MICNGKKLKSIILQIRKCIHFRNFIFIDIPNNYKNNETIIKSNQSFINDFQSIELENGDYCMVSYFEDFENIYLSKAIINQENVYEVHNLSIILKTMDSKG